jgi:hypothetical protein
MVIRWIADIGVTGGADNAREAAHALFVIGDCAGIASITPDLQGTERTVYEGAAAACSAAFLGQTARWADAESALKRVDPVAAEGLDCLARPVYDTLAELLRLHRQFPTATITRSTGAPAPSPCPRIRYLAPDEGPRNVPHTVRFFGENLPEVATVFVDGKPSTVTTDTRSGTIVIPADDGAAGSGRSVWPMGWPLEWIETAFFRYTD